MSDFSNSVLAVTGAGGHLGRAVVAQLKARGAKHIVAITRDPARLTEPGVEIRAGDFNDPQSLTRAFAGVERLLIISTDAVGTRLGQHQAAIAAAEAAGVKHIVYTGLTSPYPDPRAPVPDSHFWTEARLTASPLTWSILRNNQYADYLLPGAEHAIASGQLFHAAAAGRRAYVTREDCAAAAAGALLGAEGRRIYDIGGSEALSGDDLAALFAELSGRPVAAVAVPAAGLIAGLRQAGVPEDMANVLARFDTDAGKGYLAIVTCDVEELTGKAPQTVASFLAPHLARAAA